MPPKLSIYKIPLLFAILSIAFYISFGYGLERSDFVKLISLYAALFFVTYILIEKFNLNFWFLAILGSVFRFILIGGIPNLSQDFYRFFWDGRLLMQGVSPYLFPPDSFTGLNIAVAQSNQLIEGMGALNASHYSNYPPINQLFFAVATLFADKSILGSAIVLRVLIILADVGILYFGKKYWSN